MAEQRRARSSRRVRDELGLELEIIDRETEAGLAAAGASPLICGEARSVLVFDIGGGSTEILWLLWKTAATASMTGPRFPQAW